MTLSTYAGLLEKLDRKKEADSIMQKALPMGTSLQLLMFGNSLNKQKKHQQAYNIFKMNFDKYPNDDYSYLGMVIGNYFLGNKKEAVMFADEGIKKSKDPNWQGYFKTLVADINSGKEMFR